MRSSSIRAAFCGLLVLIAARGAEAQIARAEILEDVVIDGRLDDWPDDMERYPIRNNYQCYGPTDLDGVDLDTSEDFRPEFRVAYNPDENLIYVAVEAIDEEQVVGNHYQQTDGCEVFVHGPGRMSRGEPLQYAGVPGGWGSYAPGWTNPGIKDHDIDDSRTRMAFSRQGDVTTYEWAVEVFDDYPDRPTLLQPGRSIGFDVVAVDKDSQGTTALLPWGPPMRDKYFHPERLGTLILLDADGNWSGGPIASANPETFVGDPDQFGEDMARLGENIARMATGMAAVGLEQAARELEKADWENRGDLEEARQQIEAARRELEAQQRQLEAQRRELEVIHRYPRDLLNSSVVENIVDALIAIFIILSIGLSIGLVAMFARRGHRPSAPNALLDELAAHLESIEQRLNDTQEVMIDLNEKYEKLDDGNR